MRQVLVTGARGDLGRLVVARALDSGFAVRGMSRAPARDDDSRVEWVAADLATGSGLAEAVAGVEAIVHAASSPNRASRQVDVHGTVRLLAHARAAGVRHFIYISIVGIDRVPYSYYQNKLAAEGVVAQGGVPWTILRATQFHSFLDKVLRPFFRWPVALLPTDFVFQPVDAVVVAERLCGTLMVGPGGRLPDLAGPQVRTLGDLARAWQAAVGLRRPMIHLPLPGRVAEAFRRGYHTNPAAADGGATWEEWLQRRYGGPGA